MGAPYEERFRTEVNDGVAVVALWYGEPHNLWRIGVWGNDLDGELDNMTPDEADALAHALCEAALYAAHERQPFGLDSDH